MGVKSAFKKLWMGVKVAAPYLTLAASFFPGGSAVGLALQTIEHLVESVEDRITGPGTGVEKATAVTNDTLAALEILTHRDVNNPKTRAIVAEITDNVVATKNLMVQVQILADRYKQLAHDLNDAIDSAKAPADPNNAPEP